MPNAQIRTDALWLVAAGTTDRHTWLAHRNRAHGLDQKVKRSSQYGGIQYHVALQADDVLD